MEGNIMQKCHHVFAVSVVALVCSNSLFAAQPIDLKNKPVSVLQSFISTQLTASHNQSTIKPISSSVDFNHTAHMRVQQTYSGYPVWGSDSVVHVPQGTNASLANLNSATTMNGTIYQGVAADLGNPSELMLGTAQTEKALTQAFQIYQKETGIKQFDNSKSKINLLVYIDKSNKAHWAYLVSFLSSEKNGMPAQPTYILDATSFSIYEHWNNVQTLENTIGSGFGGNPKMGKLTYDSLKNDYPLLDIQRNASKNTCYLRNEHVIVQDGSKDAPPFSDAPVAQFKCAAVDTDHSNAYWDGDLDAVNGGYSPANDALYIGQVIRDMYQKWYKLPVLAENGKPMMLKLNVHAKDMWGQVMENAFFLAMNSEMYFGDGIKMFYPLTSLGVGAHEISHGFTSQHSNLTYQKQSGGLNESFSDMAAQAAEFYSTGKNSWQIGPEIVKGEGALRYMDDPTKDGHSIDNMKDYTDSLNVHYTSGVFNKVYYLIGSAKEWDARKAFDVMVKANMDYWTANSTFADAACGVVKATKDYKYDVDVVVDAFKGVGIDTSKC